MTKSRKFSLNPLNPLQKSFLLSLKDFSRNEPADQGPPMEINNQTKPNNALLTMFAGCTHSPLLFRVE